MLVQDRVQELVGRIQHLQGMAARNKGDAVISKQVPVLSNSHAAHGPKHCTSALPSGRAMVCAAPRLRLLAVLWWHLVSYR